MHRAAFECRLVAYADNMKYATGPGRRPHRVRPPEPAAARQRRAIGMPAAAGRRGQRPNRYRRPGRFPGEKAAAGRAGSERHANMAPDCPPGIGGKYHLAGGLLGENGRTNGVLADGPG
jgi:hypothetical protein